MVRRETRRGKGNVVRRMFADIEADIYVMVDGDDTYDAAAAPELVERLLGRPARPVVGVRRADDRPDAYRPATGSATRCSTGWSGCCSASSRRHAQRLPGVLAPVREELPVVSREFEIETELTVHAMQMRVPQTEIEVGFKDRPEGSESKLRTYRDGLRILRLIALLLQHERPVVFYGLVSALFVLAG